jgi:hypothetical protein
MLVEEYKLWSSSLCSFLHPPVTSLSFIVRLGKQCLMCITVSEEEWKKAGFSNSSLATPESLCGLKWKVKWQIKLEHNGRRRDTGI